MNRDGKRLTSDLSGRLVFYHIAIDKLWDMAGAPTGINVNEITFSFAWQIEFWDGTTENLNGRNADDK